MVSISWKRPLPREDVMANWLVTAIPLIPEVIRLATPYFSKKPAGQLQLPDLAASIAELQDAARANADAITRNAEALETFAANTQKAAETVQTRIAELHRELRVARTLSLVAATAAVLAFCLVAYALAVA